MQCLLWSKIFAYCLRIFEDEEGANITPSDVNNLIEISNSWNHKNKDVCLEFVEAKTNASNFMTDSFNKFSDIYHKSNNWHSTTIIKVFHFICGHLTPKIPSFIKWHLNVLNYLLAILHHLCNKRKNKDLEFNSKPQSK